MDEYEGEEIVVTARLSDDSGGGGGGGGGWGSWDSFDFGWGSGGDGGAYGGVDFGGGAGVPTGEPPAEEPPVEEPPPEEVVVTAEPLPYTVEQYPDGTTVARAYDFWTGESYIVSVGPDGSVLTGTQPFDVNDFSNEPYMNYPSSSDWGSYDLA